MDFFRIKFDYLKEDETDGKVITMKREDLVAAVNYTEAEVIANEYMSSLGALGDNIKYEILKTKIEEFLLTKAFSIDKDIRKGCVQYYFEEDAEEIAAPALFSVKVLYTEILDNGKKKKTTESIYVPAANNRSAYESVSKYLTKVETRDWSIRDVKFDKASSVLVTLEMHSSYVSKMDNAVL